MQFESIKGNMQCFLDLMHACGGTQGMIDKGIPWEKVAWGAPMTVILTTFILKLNNK